MRIGMRRGRYRVTSTGRAGMRVGPFSVYSGSRRGGQAHDDDEIAMVLTFGIVVVGVLVWLAITHLLIFLLGLAVFVGAIVWEVVNDEPPAAPAPPPVTATPVRRAPATVECPACGYEATAAYRRCPKCAEDLPG